MLIFTQWSFALLAIGAVVLSSITRSAGGNRTWALILSLGTIFIGLAMYFTYDVSGILPAAVGFFALLIAILPKRKH